jgi:hypothetical protein
LTYRPDTANRYDKSAVAVYKGDKKIGYVKKVHNKTFLKYPNLSMIVKAINKNGFIQQIFVEVKG